jgi:hypothetical protein
MPTTTLPIHPCIAEGTDRIRFGVEILRLLADQVAPHVTVA